MRINARIGLILLAVVAVVAGGLWVMFRHQPPKAVGSPIATATYLCDGGKSITAVYYKGVTTPVAPGQPPVPSGVVALTLSDGRAMTLGQTISADGGRYANDDESFVFWSKGNGALVLERAGQSAFTGCIVVAPQPAGAMSLPQMYANSTHGFSLRLPAGYTPDASYRFQEFGPGKDIAGVKFTIPSSMATGTNLGRDTYVSVEEIPNVRDCSASLFLEKVKPHTETDYGTTYSVASAAGAGAGNRYGETVYAIPGTSPCIAVRYFIHHMVLENYPAGTVKPFDKQAILDQFDAIRSTLTIR